VAGKRVLAAGLLLGVSASLYGPAPAAALSCAAHPDGLREAIASGTEVLAGGEPFFESYDFALIGTVARITTDEQQESPRFGATTIVFDVAATLVPAPEAAQLVVSASDPGWMSGYAFAVGRSYFVPVLGTGPQGEPNDSFVCDPITEVAEPAAADALAPLAAAAGIAFVRPANDGPQAPPPELAALPAQPDTGARTAWWSPALILGGAGAIVLAIGIATHGRHRDRSAPAA
jgi:hypothetical protein